MLIPCFYKKRLYQTLHKEHYFPNATAKEVEINLDHDST